MTHDPIEKASSDANNLLRIAERCVSSARSFEATKYAKARADAAAAIAALEAAKPDHASLADLRARFDDLAVKADECETENVRSPIAGFPGAAAREVESFERQRTERRAGDIDPAPYADKQLEWAGRMRKALDDARDRLGGVCGQALIAEIEGWIADCERRADHLRFLAEALALLDLKADTPVYGAIRMREALSSVKKNFDWGDPDKVVLAWDAAKKLIPAFRDPRFAEVPEIKDAVTLFEELEQRVAAELRPMLAKVRMTPLIRTAQSALDSLKTEIDNLDEERVLRFRKELREAVAPLVRDWSDQPDAQDLIAKAARAFVRSEDDLGDKIVMREIQEVEQIVRPVVERLERALDRRSLPAVRDHAPRLRAHLGALDPFLDRQRAQILKERADAALARIEADLGAAVASEVAEAEAVPRYVIDDAADTHVQAVLRKLDAALSRYHDTYAAAQRELETRVDLAATPGNVTSRARDSVDGAARELIKAARAAEELTDELARLDRAHPAVEEVRTAAPKLVKRAQAWKELVGKKCDYAAVLDRARSAYERATRPETASREQAAEQWGDVVRWMDEAAAAAKEAVAILPDDHGEADDWGARAAALRQEAVEQLTAICVAGVTAYAKEGPGADWQARQLADTLKRALPDAPENDQLVALLAGSADARQRAQLEIRTRAAELRRRAEAAAQAARPAYDAWVAERKPIVTLAGTIVANLGEHTGKWVVGACSSLGEALADEPFPIHGDIYQIDYDPEVRAQLEAGMNRLRGLHKEMCEAVMRKFDATAIDTSSGYYPVDAHYACEIVGTASYTPQREMRDASGRVIGTIAGTPYPVPRVVLRAVATSCYVIVPGQPPSVDAVTADALVDA
jgi:hypothetical protein